MARGAYEYALDLLAARAYTVRNLRRKLVQKEFDSAEVTATIERLLSSGLIDDGKYAEAFVRARVRGKGASRPRLLQCLRTRGVESSLAEAAIDSVLADEEVDLESMAARAAEKKLRMLRGMDGVVVRRRLYAFLGRQGYPATTIRKTLDRLLEGPD